MDDSLEYRQPYKVTNKRNVVIGIFVFSAIAAVVLWSMEVASAPTAYQAANILIAVGYAVAVAMWCHMDARERGVKLGGGFKLLVLLLPPLAVIYYLIKSRGLKRGLISTLKVTGLFILLLLMDTVINVVLSVIGDLVWKIRSLAGF